VIRRNIDAVVMQIRREISEACSKAADARIEPLALLREHNLRAGAELLPT
jgi:hypothetical protein